MIRINVPTSSLLLDLKVLDLEQNHFGRSLGPSLPTPEVDAQVCSSPRVLVAREKQTVAQDPIQGARMRQTCKA